MKLLILSCLLGAAAAGALGGYPGAGGAAAGAGGYAAAGAESTRPQAAAERAARILALDSDVKEDSFRYNYETENGIKAEETGHEANGIEAQGGFQYTGDDGQVYSVSYAAGEGGFQAQGAHLPTPPPTPDDILKALEQNARDEAAGIIDDGTYNAAKYAGEGQAAAGQQYAQYQQRPQSQQKPYKY